MEHTNFPGGPLALPLVGDHSFETLSSREQAGIIGSMPLAARRLVMKVLDPDDAADMLQLLQPAEREELLSFLDPPARAEVRALLAYSEDVAGGLMNPRYLRIRSFMTVDQAIVYVRKQVSAGVATNSYIYVLDVQQKLQGVISMRELMLASDGTKIADVMKKDVITVSDTMPQLEVADVVSREGLIALPVVDASGVMKGVVTADDVVHAVRDEATDDIQKLGGMAAIGSPYLAAPLRTMIGKRAGWLVVLFLGELLTASAMAHFEVSIAKAVVLALFLPLIISSGGNAGSQASTLVIRAMALGEVKLGDWFRVFRRELVTALSLGIILGAIGVLRVVLWQGVFGVYGDHFILLGLTVGLSLVGVVLWGSLVGSLLPFVFRRFGFDPATACAPFVATLVDVTGVVIYFSVALALLTGSML